jgi:hypothetical protein
MERRHIDMSPLHSDPLWCPPQSPHERHNEVRDQLVFTRLLPEALPVLEKGHQVRRLRDDAV